MLFGCLRLIPVVDILRFVVVVGWLIFVIGYMSLIVDGWLLMVDDWLSVAVVGV